MVDHQGGDDVAALTVPVVELAVAQAARLALPQRAAARSADVADRHAGRRGSSATPRSSPPRPRSAATTPAPAPTAGWSAAAPPATCMAVYYGDGDQTLDFRTFQDHAAPDTTSNLLFKGAVGGRSALGLHGPHPGAARGPGHQRLPDQPHDQAERARLGRVGAQPRDREQRRPLQPRVRRRPDRRGAALLPREPGRAARGRRAAHRRGLLPRRARRRCPAPTR